MKKLVALIVSLCMLAGMLPAMAETATEAPAAAPADAEKVDMNHLIDQLLNDINNAVVRVDAEEAQTGRRRWSFENDCFSMPEKDDDRQTLNEYINSLY